MKGEKNEKSFSEKEGFLKRREEKMELHLIQLDIALRELNSHQSKWNNPPKSSTP